MKLSVCIFGLILSCLLALPCSATDSNSVVASDPVDISDPILAVVGGVAKIRVSDLESEMANLPDHLKSLAVTPEGRKEMLDTMIIREMILLEAKTANIENDPAVIAKFQDLKRRVIVERFLKSRVEADAMVTDAELLDYYNKNKDRFTVEEEIRVGLITVDNDVMAEGIVAKIKAGESFEELAKKYSTDTRSSANGGDIGWVSAGEIDPALEKIAFSLEANKVSGVVKSELGYQVVKASGKRSNYLYPLAEVKDLVKKSVIEAKQKDSFTKVKADLRAKYKTKMDDKALEKLTASE